MRALTFCRLLRLFMFFEPTPEDICWNWKKFLRPIKMWSGLLQRFPKNYTLRLQLLNGYHPY